MLPFRRPRSRDVDRNRASEWTHGAVADRQGLLRYNAACAAALAAAGQDQDDPHSEDVAKAEYRREARHWLEAELRTWKQVATDAPGSRARIVRILLHWKKDADLAGIRSASAIDKLPEAERTEWRAFWNDVDMMLTDLAKK